MQIKQDSRRCKFVSFSGIDGAGKSTQIANLRARLQDAGMRVVLVTFWDDVARLKRIREGAGHTLFKGEKGVGSPEKPVNRRDKNVRSWPMSLVRLGLYFVDALSLRVTVSKSLRAGADFVICDRYIYDELANLNLGNPLARAYVRMIMKLVPRPDVSYFLDADPAAARARKPEYPLEFLYISRASYFTLIGLIGGITVIPPMSIQDAEREVIRHALTLLSSEELQNQPAEHLVSER
ncbi:MAG: thymidylate kinase [Acidobacteriaceae bacterium]